MTDSDAKEWVTIKVPKADKEQADNYRPDDSTFGDCLVAGAERLNDSLASDPGPREEKLHSDDLREQLDRIESAVSTPEDEGLYRGSMSDVLADLQDQLDDVKSAAGTAEERTGQIQGTLEDMGARR